MTKGILTARIERTYPLREAAQAHRDLEARRTIGSVVLIP
jgi:NADPH2:quinone reductase